MALIERLTEVFKDVFDDDSLILSQELSAKDIVDWDSLMHVTLILAVEREFSIRLTSSEVTRLKNVGDFIELIEKKL